MVKLKFLSALAVLTTLTVPTIAMASPTAFKVAQTTIRDLQRANTVSVSGEVVRLQGDDFILSDGTGQMLVEAEWQAIRQANLKPGDRVTVAGRYDDDNTFEALTITTRQGQLIYVFDD